MALPTNADGRGRVQAVTTGASITQNDPSHSTSTPEAPQSQLAYATERLELSAKLMVEMHNELNDFFSTVFGRDNLTEPPCEAVDREAGEVNDLMYAIQQMHRQLDVVRADIGFLKDQNL